MNRCNHLVKFEGNVYFWGTVISTRKGKMALVSPVNGGEEIAIPVKKLRLLPTPGMKTTYAYCGSR